MNKPEPSNALEQEATTIDKKLARTLSSPGVLRVEDKGGSRNENSYGSLTSSHLPRINFSYVSKEAWRKK